MFIEIEGFIIKADSIISVTNDVNSITIQADKPYQISFLTAEESARYMHDLKITLDNRFGVIKLSV